MVSLIPWRPRRPSKVLAEESRVPETLVRMYEITAGQIVMFNGELWVHMPGEMWRKATDAEMKGAIDDLLARVEEATDPAPNLRLMAGMEGLLEGED